MDKVVIQMTDFIFEDGNTYYFKIYKREGSNSFHDLYVYEKKESKTWYGSAKTEYIRLNSSPELIDINLISYDIKEHIKKILTGNRADYAIKDWDGFVGDVPDDAKKSLARNSKLDNLGI